MIKVRSGFALNMFRVKRLLYCPRSPLGAEITNYRISHRSLGKQVKNRRKVNFNQKSFQIAYYGKRWIQHLLFSENNSMMGRQDSLKWLSLGLSRWLSHSLFVRSCLKVLDTSFVNRQRACIPKLRRAFLVHFVGLNITGCYGSTFLSLASSWCKDALWPGLLLWQLFQTTLVCRALYPRQRAGSGELRAPAHGCYPSEYTRCTHTRQPRLFPYHKEQEGLPPGREEKQPFET